MTDSRTWSSPPAAAAPRPLDERARDLVERAFGRMCGTTRWSERTSASTEDSRSQRLVPGRGAQGSPRSRPTSPGGRGGRGRRPGLSPLERIERDLEIDLRRNDLRHRRDPECRTRSAALDAVGDALFLIFAQDFAPSMSGKSIAGKLEEFAYLEQSKCRLPSPEQALAAARRSSRRPTSSFADEIVAATTACPT